MGDIWGFNGFSVDTCGGEQMCSLLGAWGEGVGGSGKRTIKCQIHLNRHNREDENSACILMYFLSITLIYRISVQLEIRKLELEYFFSVR